jgi:rhodanese-related sulfurtransferase
MMFVRSSCYAKLTLAIKESYESTHGELPWVVFFYFPEKLNSGSIYSTHNLNKIYSIPLECILPIQNFDGDPLDVDNYKPFTKNEAQSIYDFILPKQGKNKDLVITCPIGQTSYAVSNALSFADPKRYKHVDYYGSGKINNRIISIFSSLFKK